MIVVDNIDELVNKYKENRRKIDGDFSALRYSHDYKETSDLEVFDFKTFVTRLKTNYGGIPSFNIDGKFTPIKGGQPITVSGRAMRVIGKGDVDNIFVLNKIEQSIPTITTSSDGLNKITL